MSTQADKRSKAVTPFTEALDKGGAGSGWERCRPLGPGLVGDGEGTPTGSSRWSIRTETLLLPLYQATWQ